MTYSELRHKVPNLFAKGKDIAIDLVLISGAVVFLSKGYFEFTRIHAASQINFSAVANEPFVPRPHTKTTGCHVDKGFPDVACTPGAIFFNVGPVQICVQGYTKTARDVSAKTKAQVYREYGISYPQPRGSYEADHMIPLELGGSNEIENLWPEAAQPQPGFREKDLVENFLHNEVCAGRMALGAAQNKISTDWEEVYTHLTPEQITELKQQFKPWN